MFVCFTGYGMPESNNIMEFDVAIIGAGPAGCTTSLGLAGSGLSVALIDKSEIPCDKVCGDALSGTVMNVLKRLPGECFRDFLALPGILPSHGIRFFSPGGSFLDVPFRKEQEKGPAPGYTCRRKVFDGFLVSRLSGSGNIHIFPGCRVDRIAINDGGVVILSTDHSFRAKIVVGADGVHGITAKTFAGKHQKRYSMGIRAYFRNVRDLHPMNFIELHFLREFLPGYLWIFPMTEGIANVGLGVLRSRDKQKDESLAAQLHRLLHEHPLLSYRFAGAVMTGKPEAHGIPPGPDPKPLSGNRFLLAGDAASLVDPFTGEGIGNAMVSGEIAAEVIKAAFRENDFSPGFLCQYDEKITRRLFPELKTSARIQQLAGSPALFNFVVKKALRKEGIRNLLTEMYISEKARSGLTKPWFYMRLLLS
jgi:geranylgeranyl reductase family protein